jgi:hypothetical protein
MQPWRWIRKSVTFTFPSGATGAALTQSKVLACEGEILNIHQVNGNNAGSRTAQITLQDPDGIQVFDGTAKAMNAGYDFEFGVTIRRLLAGRNTLNCIISGDPGAGGYTVTVVINFIGRDG